MGGGAVMSLMFNYKARDLSGQIVCGQIKCGSPGAVAAILRKKNCYAVDIKPARGPILDWDKVFCAKVDISSMAFFCRRLSFMLDAGATLSHCFAVLVGQTENKRLTSVLREVISDVEQGKSLSEAFRVHQNCLPRVFINMMAAGEASGTLGKVVAHLATHFEKEHRLREKVKSAMMYPLLVAIMMLVSIVGMLIFVVPVFSDMFASVGAELPLPTRIVVGLSDALVSYWYMIPLLGIVLYLALKQACAGESRRVAMNRFLLKMPLLGQAMRQMITARFNRILATLLMSGMPLVPALQVVERVSGNALLAQKIRKVRTNINEGEGIALSLERCALFPPMVPQMIAVGEETGRLDTVLEKLAVYYEEEAENFLTSLSHLIEPVLIAFMGLVVAFVALSVYLPLFGLSDVMQAGGM